MALFNFKKKNRVLDLTEAMTKKQAQLNAMQSESSGYSSMPTTSSSSSTTDSSATAQGFNFLSGLANAAGSQNSTENSSESSYVDVSSNPDEKRRRLAKRLMAITDKLEDISNQIYHLQQRLEVIEKKTGVGSGY